MEYPDLSIEELQNALSDRQVAIGNELIFFPVIGSTNTAAAELATKGQREGTVLIADMQTEGRGRRGRTWVSPAGKNLYLSIIVRPPLRPQDAPLLTLMSAVACASALQKLSSAQIAIKWPNDIMAADKKMGGVLTEMKSKGNSIEYAVIGIGININSDRSDMPDDIRETSTSVRLQTGQLQSRTRYALEIIQSMDHWYTILLESGKEVIIRSWRHLSSTIGRMVYVMAGETLFTGLAEDIDSDGMLMLRLNDQSVKTISAADVTVLGTKHVDRC